MIIIVIVIATVLVAINALVLVAINVVNLFIRINHHKLIVGCRYFL